MEIVSNFSRAQSQLLCQEMGSDLVPFQGMSVAAQWPATVHYFHVRAFLWFLIVYCHFCLTISKTVVFFRSLHTSYCCLCWDLHFCKLLRVIPGSDYMNSARFWHVFSWLTNFQWQAVRQEQRTSLVVWHNRRTHTHAHNLTMFFWYFLANFDSSN